MAQRPLAELSESPQNPRTISEARLQALMADMSRDPMMLWARPVIALADGTVVAGNMRLRAARELGWSEVPTFVADLDEARAREWMLRDNAAYGDWVPGMLADTIAEAAAAGQTTDHFGFTPAEVRNFLKKSAGEAQNAAQSLPQVFGVVIDCDTEHQQAELLERFDSEGLRARALLA